MIYNNQITLKQFIGAIAFILGVLFGCVVASEGPLDHWVSYWGAIYSFLFIIAAPAYILGWHWADKTLITAFILFIGYNLYNTTSEILEGNSGVFVGIPISITSICIIISILNNTHKPSFISKYTKETMTPCVLFTISMLSFWICMFIEMISSLLKTGLQSYLIIGILWFFFLILLSVGFVFKIKAFRIILSVFIHIQLIVGLFMIGVNNIISEQLDGLWVSVILVILNIILILGLHNKYIGKGIPYTKAPTE